MISGIRNLGGTCYLNSLVQALLGIKTFTNELDSDEFARNFMAKNMVYLLEKLELPKTASCAHEAWMKMLDSEFFYLKHLFELEYEINGKKEIVTEVVSPLTNNIFDFKDDIGRHFILINKPKIITVITKKWIGEIEDYKLVSIINFTGGHYNCFSLREGKGYLFDDLVVKESPLVPNNQSLIYFYESNHII